MSVASEFPPEVHIPDRARRFAPRPRHLVVVPAALLVHAPVTAAPEPKAVAAGSVPLAVPMRGPDSSRVVGPGQHAGFRNRVCFEEVDASPSSVRLTRRGRLAATIAVVAAALGLLVLAHASRAAAPQALPPAAAVPASTVVVRDGDTLWSIAQRVDPASDPRLVVDRLRRVNHLASVNLSVGQTLNVR